MIAVHEIATDVFRLSAYVPALDMQFNHFLVRDDEPQLFHTGLKGMFPALGATAAQLIDPVRLRYVAWSQFERTSAARSTRGWASRRTRSRCAPSSANW